MWVDFARVYEGGLTYGHLDDAAPGVEVKAGSYLVLGDEDADPAVAQVVEVRPDGVVLLRVLPGHADLHRQLLDHCS
jgi:NADPH-dependent ferric siderophore reductase